MLYLAQALSHKGCEAQAWLIIILGPFVQRNLLQKEEETRSQIFRNLHNLAMLSVLEGIWKSNLPRLDFFAAEEES